MTPSSSGARGRTGYKDDVAEQSPAVRMDLGSSDCITNMVTETFTQDEAEN